MAMTEGCEQSDSVPAGDFVRLQQVAPKQALPAPPWPGRGKSALAWGLPQELAVTNSPG
jgi:hypothetical protein